MMTLLQLPLHFILIVIFTSVAISLPACSEQTEDASSTQVTTVSPAGASTDGRIAQLQREADEGDPDAQYDLAYMYENGLGVPKDEAKALQLYRQAADQGHSEAQNNIAARKGN